MIEIKIPIFSTKRLPKIKIFIFILMTMSISAVFMIFFRTQDLIQTTGDTFCGENNFGSTRLMRLEQLSYGDRNKKQMYFLPKDYKYVITPYKRILIQNSIGAERELLKFEQGDFIGCPVSQCWLTYKSLGSNVDAVLFRDYCKRPEYRRPPNQIWILLNNEFPHHSSSIKNANVLNWTANNHCDSGVLHLYGYFMKNNLLLARDEEKNYTLHKTKKVAWFVSNCNPNSNYTIYYANALAKHITVDVYGGCGKNKSPKTKEMECFKMLTNDYKFYLSFENSHSVYYVTEKLLVNALSNDVLPIVIGLKRRDYELMVPENSFIHVDNFQSLKELANYLLFLDENHQLCNEYLRIRGSGTVIQDTRFY